MPEVMIPLVATQARAGNPEGAGRQAADAVFAEKGRTLDYLVGTMIELPRAALMAGEIAEVGEFFSFGTNDLTQTTLGVSRDDAARFLTPYVDKGIYRARSVRLARYRRRRPAGRDWPPSAAARPGPTSSSASAANMAAIRPASHSAKRSASITSAPLPIACRSPGWRRRRRHCARFNHRSACPARGGACMKPWLRYSICILLGLAGGSAYAVHQVRSADLGRQVTNGPWSTNTDNGTKDASAQAAPAWRCSVCLRCPPRKRCTSPRAPTAKAHR